MQDSDLHTLPLMTPACITSLYAQRSKILLWKKYPHCIAYRFIMNLVHFENIALVYIESLSCLLSILQNNFLLLVIDII